jgi:hypothetical protein
MSTRAVLIISALFSALSFVSGVVVPYFSYSPARGFFENYVWSQVYGLGGRLFPGAPLIALAIWPLIVAGIVFIAPAIAGRGMELRRIHWLIACGVFLFSLLPCFWSARVDGDFYKKFHSYVKYMYVKY